MITDNNSRFVKGMILNDDKEISYDNLEISISSSIINYMNPLIKFSIHLTTISDEIISLYV
jgi:hypothetical protein